MKIVTLAGRLVKHYQQVSGSAGYLLSGRTELYKEVEEVWSYALMP